ncbi:MAG: GDSL-type esterase/lipase family protein [Planctomycetaceae bacterium]
MNRIAIMIAIMLSSPAYAQTILPCEVQLDVIHQELSPDFCWFHPRVAAIPNSNSAAQTVICTLQKHLGVSDHYSGLYYMRSDDGGRTWSEPVLPPELDWVDDHGETIAVCDVTPGWHPQTSRMLAIGTKLRYSAAGEQLLDQPRSHQAAYAVYDPASGKWTAWKMLRMPNEESQNYLVAPGCVQWLVRPDGTLLLPMYARGPSGTDYASTVLHCDFDGSELTLIEAGDELKFKGGRGLCEPSLALFQGTYFLTLRNDAGGYVTTSSDGLHYAPIAPWTFDDGSELGSYNTQQHWLVHDQALFLSYTRRGANNDHIMRNRAPLFMAQIDPVKKHVIRSTEKILIPERGAMLGNFGATAISSGESWVTDAEYYTGTSPHASGADNSVFAARVKWSVPNKISTVSPQRRIVVLGDSITKGVRTGVAESETFGARLQTSLRATGLRIDVINQGIGGERTDQALARLNRDILSLEPEIVIVMYGTNDSYVDQGQQRCRITATEYRQNLEKIVADLRRVGIQPILMTEPRWGDKAGLNGVGEHPNVRLQEYVAECRAVAEQTQTPLIDHFAAWSNANSKGIDIGSWTTDECHPNPAGHLKIAEAMLPVVLKAVTDQ